MNKYIFFLIGSLFAGSLLAQQYENKAIITIGSGVLEGGNYKSIVTLGEPGGPSKMDEESIYAVNAGFIYVSKKPLENVLGLSLDLKEIKLYPNPTERELHLNYSVNNGVEELMLEIISLDGKKMISKIIPSVPGQHSVAIDVQHLDQSVYIFSIQSPDDRFKVKMRFIKK